MLKRVAVCGLTLCLVLPLALWGIILPLSPRAAAYTLPLSTAFVDIVGHPDADSILKLVDMGVVAGYGAGRFGPEDPVTREQFAKMIVLACGIQVENGVPSPGFADAREISDWARPYVAAAFDRTLIRGMGGNRFSPQANVTRAQALTMIARAAVGEPALEAMDGAYAATKFADDAAVEYWARPAVNYCFKQAIVSLDDYACLDPGKDCTRAMNCRYLARAVENGLTPRSLRGNTTGNILNGGIFCYSDCWVYYSHFDEGGGASLRRMRLDGSADEMIYDGCARYINVYDGWVYFLWDRDTHPGIIMRARIDTWETQFLLEGGAVCHLQVVDGWIYFAGWVEQVPRAARASQQEAGVWRMRTDGSSFQLLFDGPSAPYQTSLNVVDGWAYFIAYKQEWKDGPINCLGVRRVRVDGTGCEVLLDPPDSDLPVGDWDMEFVIVDDGFVYLSLTSYGEYNSGDDDRVQLYRMRLDGSARGLVFDENRYTLYDAWAGTNISDGWIYLPGPLVDDFAFNLYRVSTDGIGLKRITDHDDSWVIIGCASWPEGTYVMGDWLVFRYPPDPNDFGGWYRVKLSGGQSELLYMVSNPGY